MSDKLTEEDLEKALERSQRQWHGKLTTTDLVTFDLKARERVGIQKYGHTVDQSPDDMLQHLYEELLDAACYIKTEIERRKINK